MGARPRRRRGRALRLGRLRAGLPRLPRRRVGPPRRRRHAAVREALPRGLPVRPLVADDPAQARGVPRAFAGFDFDAGRRASATRTSSACSATRGSSATAARSRRRSTTRSARSSWSRPRARSPRSSGVSSPPARASRARERDRGVARAREGAQAPRLALRRPDDGLRVHAGDGAGQRPPRGLRRARAARSARARTISPWAPARSSWIGVVETLGFPRLAHGVRMRVMRLPHDLRGDSTARHTGRAQQSGALEHEVERATRIGSRGEPRCADRPAHTVLLPTTSTQLAR